MQEADRRRETERLANDIAGLIEARAPELQGNALEICATALMCNLASAVAAYAPADRVRAEQNLVEGLHARIGELEKAGLAAPAAAH